MATPQENNATAQTAAKEAIVQRVGANLKNRWKTIAGQMGLAVPTTGEDGNDPFEKYARDLVEFGTFTAKTKSMLPQDTPVGVEQIKNAFKTHPLSASITQELDAIPDKSGADAIAGAIGSAAEENTGTIGFLGGATFSAAIRGFLQWIMELISWMFNGEKGSQAPTLTGTIASIAANDVAESTGAKLEKLRNDKPELSSSLTDERIKDIKENVRYGALRESGHPDPNEPKSVSIADTVMDNKEYSEHAIKQQISATAKPQIKSAIINGVRQKMAEMVQNDKGKGYWNQEGYVRYKIGKDADGKVPEYEKAAQNIRELKDDEFLKRVDTLPSQSPVNRDKIEAASDIIAGVVAKKVSDSNFKPQDKDEFATQMTQAVVAEIETNTSLEWMTDVKDNKRQFSADAKAQMQNTFEKQYEGELKMLLEARTKEGSAPSVDASAPSSPSNTPAKSATKPQPPSPPPAQVGQAPAAQAGASPSR